MAAHEKSEEDVAEKTSGKEAVEKDDSAELTVMSAMKPDTDTVVANGDQASSNKDLNDHQEACITNGACENEIVGSDLLTKVSVKQNSENKNLKIVTGKCSNEFNGQLNPIVNEDDLKVTDLNEMIPNGIEIGSETVDVNLKDANTISDRSRTKSISDGERRSRSSTPTRNCRLKDENVSSGSATPISCSRESTPVSTISSRGATPAPLSSRDSTPVPQTGSRGSTPGPTVNSGKLSVAQDNIESNSDDISGVAHRENLSCSPPIGSSRSNIYPLGSRSSEERSVDSDSSSSKPKMPKARKSAIPSKSGLSISNVTVKLPDFENPIKLDTKTLEKISMLGKAHDHNKSHPVGGSEAKSDSTASKTGSKFRKIGACTSKTNKTSEAVKSLSDTTTGKDNENLKEIKGKGKSSKMDMESNETIKKLSKVEAKLGVIGMRSARKIKRLGRGRLKSVGIDRDSPIKNKKSKRKIFSRKFDDNANSEEMVDESTKNTNLPVTSKVRSPIKVSSRVKKRRKKMGTYKLPNEIKKKATTKKKDDRKYDSDCSDASQLSEGRKREKINTMENVDEFESDNVDSSIVSESDTSMINANAVSESDTSINESLNDSQVNSSQTESDKKPIWDIFRRTNVGEKTKNTLGSIRGSRFNSLKKSPSSSQSERKKTPTIAEYMNMKTKLNSSSDSYIKQEHVETTDCGVGTERISSTTDDVDGLVDGDKRGLRKRKKEDEDGDSNTEIIDSDFGTGKKKKMEEVENITSQASSLLSPSSYRSLLPKNIIPSISNAVTSAQSVLPVNSVSSTAMVSTSSKLLLTVAQPATSINSLVSNKPPQFLLLTTNQGTGTLLQPLPVFPPPSTKPPGGSFIQQVPVPVLSPRVAMVTNKASSGGICLLNNQLALNNQVSSNQLQLNSNAEPVDSSRPVLSSLLSVPPEFTTYQDKENSVTSDNSSYPVTPPRTPDDQQSEDSMASAPSGPTPPDKDIIPLCCCKINGASFKKLGSSVTYCQALDSIDGKVMGCCNKVTNYQLVRPGVKIPFMAVCEAHRKRLRLHQCCPGCGHFCTQGKFNQCKKEGSVSIHHFHHQCQVIRDSKNYCPHCGEVSGQVEVTLTLEQPRNNTVFEDKCSRGVSNRARMGANKSFLKDKENIEDSATASHKLSNDKIISTGGIPLGPDKYSLEKVLNGLAEERPRKYKSKFLYNPAYEGDLERVVFMLADGYDPNEVIEDFDNQTSLHAAAICGNLAIVHVLVQAGANIHAVDKELKTPLMYAAENNYLEVTQYLIKAGAQVDQKAEDGMTVLHYSAKAGHVDIIRCLLDTDEIKSDVQDDGGWTPIIWASEHKFVDAVKYLIKRGADANLKDKEENTALHWAAFSGSVDIAEIFLNAGCDVESPNEHGDRPLHIAARQDHYECVVLFLARGADVEAKNNEKETAIGCCPDENSQVCLALKVNRQLKGFATKSFCKIEKLVHRDVSMGRENIPIAVINGEDEEPLPNDFQYITENCETSTLNINRTITSLQSCRCSDDCSSMFCVCGRNSIKCWFNKEMRLLPDFNMLEPPLIFECNKGCRCWSTCNNRVVQMGITCRLQIFRTNGRGWGVKTLLDIPVGTFVCEYIGELISDSEADSREDDSYLFDLDNRDGDTYCIDARKYGNISRFINHLCEPNLIPVKVFVDHQDLRFPRICFFSSREIKAHEELGFDYGEKFWIIKWKQFTCACGSTKCKYSTDTIQKTLEDYRLRHEDDDTANQD